MALLEPTWTCSDFSRAAGEPLIGSAPRADLWLLLEYSGSWGRNALKASTIPQSVKDALTEIENTIPNSRIELIKQEKPRGDNTIAFFIARTSALDPSLVRFDLAGYEDLLKVDIPAIAAGQVGADVAAHAAGPIAIVCTNGRRDACCARNGLPVYRAMAQAAPGQVWECTHLGGHRLSPNVVTLPDGLVYGRVTPEAVEDILDAGHIRLDNLRGRSSFEPPAQAAEAFLRRQTGQMASGGLSLLDLAGTGEAHWSVTLTLDGRPYVVRVEQRPAGYATYASCGDEQPKDVQEFRLIDIS